MSLHRTDGALRGCLGTMEARAPLAEEVERMAVAAAVSDPRFTPVSAAELQDCVLEISALTPRSPARAQDVHVGRHGVAVRRGAQRGVLLPQVAVEHGWSREELLDHVCMKAGLPREAWRNDPAVQLEVFEAEVFGE